MGCLLELAQVTLQPIHLCIWNLTSDVLTGPDRNINKMSLLCLVMPHVFRQSVFSTAGEWAQKIIEQSDCSPAFDTELSSWYPEHKPLLLLTISACHIHLCVLGCQLFCCCVPNACVCSGHDIRLALKITVAERSDKVKQTTKGKVGTRWHSTC